MMSYNLSQTTREASGIVSNLAVYDYDEGHEADQLGVFLLRIVWALFAIVSASSPRF